MSPFLKQVERVVREDRPALWLTKQGFKSPGRPTRNIHLSQTFNEPYVAPTDANKDLRPRQTKKEL